MFVTSEYPTLPFTENPLPTLDSGECVGLFYTGTESKGST